MEEQVRNEDPGQGVVCASECEGRFELQGEGDQTTACYSDVGGEEERGVLEDDAIPDDEVPQQLDVTWPQRLVVDDVQDDVALGQDGADDVEEEVGEGQCEERHRHDVVEADLEEDDDVDAVGDGAEELDNEPQGNHEQEGDAWRLVVDEINDRSHRQRCGRDVRRFLQGHLSRWIHILHNNVLFLYSSELKYLFLYIFVLRQNCN